MRATLPLLLKTDFPAIRRRRLETVQANLGYVCNQACLHCHVNAGPTRTESMSAQTIEHLLEFLAASGAKALDLTGGAPELNPHFRPLVARARALGTNFAETRFGVITRISVHPAASPLYGTTVAGTHVDALAVRYDPNAWERRFLASWPESSPAHQSYFSRITHGPKFTSELAMRRAA